MSLEGKRIAILAEQDFEDSELTEPLKAMKEAGAKVFVVGSGTQQSYKGKRGKATIKVDIDADKVKAEDFDAIIIPGGYAPDKMRLHQPMIDLVKKAHDLGRVIAAICHGPQLLISAEIVRERHVTSWPSVAIDLKNAGASWVDQPVVRDCNIIMSRKPGDLAEFNKSIIETIEGTATMLEKEILSKYRTVAIVGASNNPERPSRRVFSYLSDHGYNVIPVNPNEPEVSGKTCYPNLSSIPEKVEVVDIFRKSEDVMHVVTEAIKIGARAVWMQEGVINEEAAAKARSAGLMVVMDKCMRKEHMCFTESKHTRS
jgi:PfpI family intracellular protease